MKGNQNVIVNLVDNIIHYIIKHNLLLTIDVNSIVTIEEQNKLLLELFMISKNLRKCGNIHSGIPSPDIKTPIISLVYDSYSKKEKSN